MAYDVEAGQCFTMMSVLGWAAVGLDGQGRSGLLWDATPVDD